LVLAIENRAASYNPRCSLLPFSNVAAGVAPKFVPNLAPRRMVGREIIGTIGVADRKHFFEVP
jgi:hypothetical protein